MNEVLLEKGFKECFCKGLKYIYPQNKMEWAEAVKKSFEGVFQGRDAVVAINVMERLAAGQNKRDIYLVELNALEGQEKLFSRALTLITQFSKSGIAFYSWVAGSRQARVMTANEEKFLSRIARNNEKYEKETMENEQCAL